jgi:hypothetical protein
VEHKLQRGIYRYLNVAIKKTSKHSRKLLVLLEMEKRYMNEGVKQRKNFEPLVISGANIF